jgi:hypothetical protein
VTAALGFLILGAILLKAGWKDQNIVDVLLGNDKTNPGGHVPDPTAQSILAGIGEGDLGTPGAPGGLTRTPVLPSAAPSGKVHGTTQFDGIPVASWIAPILHAARSTGRWRGRVTSGYRSPNEVVTPSPGLPVAPQGKSNHNGTIFPKGAVDVSDPGGLEDALKHVAGGYLLKRGTAIGDPIHFSATGR